MTFMTIPSTISGGPSVFQVRIGSGEVLSAGDEADVLLAFYQHSYEGHIAHLREGGIVLYDSDHVTVNEEWAGKFSHVGVAISSLTIEAIGGTAKDKGKNIFALGLLAKVFGLDTNKLLKLMDERFGGKGEGVLQNALNAYHAGYAYEVGDLLETFHFLDSTRRDKDQVVCSGNESLAYGLIAAGVRFGAGYPITPWSDIMELLRRELPKYGGMFIQCEDEIASVSMAIGASYSGGVAVTGSSGPGISLKSEAIGWAVMAEIPLVICNIQRGGPSTGLPTSVEQSDLNIACFGGHGDSPRVVLAPRDVEDCFYTAMEAVRIARQYSVPVFILSDQAIATRIEAFAEPDLSALCEEIGPDFTPVPTHRPYDLSPEDGVSPHVPPGTRVLDGKYPVVTGLEHDEMGHPSGAPKMHMAMTAKRRRKLQKLASELPLPEIQGPDSGDVLLVGWGSTWGPVSEAVNVAATRDSSFTVSAVNMRHLNPMPEKLGDLFDRFQNIYVVETNDGGIYGYGQLCMILRARFCNPKIQGINKTDGLTFKVREILDAVSDRMALAITA
jgi:2-oxoglutarate ferredoxin oxidoreductase subunit alpha